MVDEKTDFDEDKLKEVTENAIESKLEIETDSLNENPRKQIKKQIEEETDEEMEKIPLAWDPREIDYLANNRDKMSKEEFSEFVQRNSEFHKAIEGSEQFSRTEERFLLQSFGELEAEKIAERLDRTEEEIKVKLKSMGLNPTKIN